MGDESGKALARVLRRMPQLTTLDLSCALAAAPPMREARGDVARITRAWGRDCRSDSPTCLPCSLCLTPLPRAFSVRARFADRTA